jgi:hypothetical protein
LLARVTSHKTKKRLTHKSRHVSILFLSIAVQEELAKEEEEENPEKQETESEVVAVRTKPMEQTKEKSEPTKSIQVVQQSRRDVSSNAFAPSNSTDSLNVVTDSPTSRVRMPPGGHQSIRLW